MLTGYNTDIKHEGTIYHVQTEDGGTDNPVIVSLIYQGGRILASKKTSYAHMLGAEDLISRLRDLLERQHRAMIKAILTGGATRDQGQARPATPQKPAPGQAQPAVQAAPQPSQPAQPQARVEAGRQPISSQPPLEIPPETVTDAPADRAAEKNLDQVILEYLASEIDKD